MPWKDVDNFRTKVKGEFYRLQDGENKIRIISEPRVRRTHWTGEGRVTCDGGRCGYCSSGDEDVSRVRVKFLVYIIDRKDGKVKLAEFGPTVMKQIREYQKEGEYAYEGVAPYDITIKREGLKLDTKYVVIPARQNTPLSDAERMEVERIVGQSSNAPLSPEQEDAIKMEEIPF